MAATTFRTRRLSSVARIIGCSAFHDRMPIILDWRHAEAWLRGDSPGALLRSPPEDALQERTVSTRVNKVGVGDDDPALIEQTENA